MPEQAQAAGVVLAAGRSSRMGWFKPLLELEGQTMLARAAAAAGLGKGPVVVVTGHRGDELSPHIAALGATETRNPDPDRGMLSSVQTGLAAVPAGLDVLVLPVDCALARPATVRALLATRADHPGAALVPHFLGRPGHPPLLPAGLIPAVRSYDGPGGLAGCLAAWPTVAVEVADGLAVLDMDTPQDLERRRADLARAAIPTLDECRALLTLVRPPKPGVLAHSRAVANLALWLTQAVAVTNASLDPKLVAAAGLLHDVAKGEPNHAQTGAELLRQLGWPRAADVVAQHVDLERGDGAPVDEAELVYLADKLVKGDRLVALETRFAAKLAKYGGDPAARAAVERRQALALQAKNRVTQAAGNNFEQWLEYASDGRGGVREHDLLAAAWPDSNQP